MVLLRDWPSQLTLDDPEERQMLNPVSWDQYEALIADLGAGSPWRVHFLAGVLEIVAPSRRHESGKTRIGDLLFIYFLETNTEYFPMGSTTLRQPDRQAGGEPDESYCIGSDKEIPDLAIEVVVTSGGIDRLELYGRLGIQEVWFWQNSTLLLYRLQATPSPESSSPAGYRPVETSDVLPQLDVALLTDCIRMPNPLAAAKAFRKGILAHRTDE